MVVTCAVSACVTELTMAFWRDSTPRGSGGDEVSMAVEAGVGTSLAALVGLGPSLAYGRMVEMRPWICKKVWAGSVVALTSAFFHGDCLVPHVLTRTTSVSQCTSFCKRLTKSSAARDLGSWSISYMDLPGTVREAINFQAASSNDLGTLAISEWPSLLKYRPLWP